MSYLDFFGVQFVHGQGRTRQVCGGCLEIVLGRRVDVVAVLFQKLLGLFRENKQLLHASIGFSKATAAAKSASAALLFSCSGIAFCETQWLKYLPPRRGPVEGIVIAEDAHQMAAKDSHRINVDMEGLHPLTHSAEKGNGMEGSMMCDSEGVQYDGHPVTLVERSRDGWWHWISQDSSTIIFFH